MKTFHTPAAEDQRIDATHNTARYFVERRQVAWVLFVATLAWGVFGYWKMPQRKDPEVAVRDALAVVRWPGMPAEKVEQLVTKKVEEAIAQNAKVTEIRSTVRTGATEVYLQLDERVADTGKQFDDIKQKLDAIAGDLPAGAGPIEFVKDFGDTAALMLTVASPKASPAEIRLRADATRTALARDRAGAAGRVAVVYCFPEALDSSLIRRALASLPAALESDSTLTAARFIESPGFVALDGTATRDDATLRERVRQWAITSPVADLHPDVWDAAIIRDPADAESALTAAAGDRYTHREMDQFSEQVEKALKVVPSVAKVSRSGALPEEIHLLYSRERLAAYGTTPAAIPAALRDRNIAQPGGSVTANGLRLPIAPTGEFRHERDIAAVKVPTAGGTATLGDLVTVQRGYESPARFLNFLHWRDAQGQWQRSRAVTLDIQMRSGEQIGLFGKAVDAALADLQRRLPSDLILARTSDQPRQVKEDVDLFMTSLWEAVALVVFVSLLGFWEWRSALIMALSIPVTLAMTFGMMHALGVDLQQVSIASLIIALGLLVDDPVVAGDAIKRELGAGRPAAVASWWGPTKLGRAILFATITNIVAYLPFLMLPGDVGKFIYTLPVVITCSLVASRLVSMTFIPLLGYHLLRPHVEAPIAERRTRGFAAFYYRLGGWAIDHRRAVLAASVVLLAAGGFFMSRLKPQFFPMELQYLSYIEVWLPENAPFRATLEASRQAEDAVRAVTTRYAQEHPGDNGQPREVLRSLTTWVGGGGPRYWLSSAPEPPQLNYAHLLIQTSDKHDTDHLVPLIQEAVSRQVPNARVDVRRLETGAPVGIPVSIRVSGSDIPALRAEAERLKSILRTVPFAERVRDDWGEDGPALTLAIDQDRAAQAGVTAADVAQAAATGTDGTTVAHLRDNDRELPVVLRLRPEERATADDLARLYVLPARGGPPVPMPQVAALTYELRPAKIRRFQQYRTITVSAFPSEGKLPSEVLDAVLPQVEEFGRTLPPGFRLEIAGEYKEQVRGFGDLAMVMGVSVGAIFLALVVQFRHAVKPLIVFAAIPYGVVGALAALWLMGAPFGFMAFLGVASLIGVIVSHIIVLFDFIEERQEEGAPLREALLDAGIQRLRPVLITVGATVTALIPLALHGGPLWEPLCYAQIGGLTLSTVVTLLLVPVVYAVAVLDLKVVRWPQTQPSSHQEVEEPALVA